MPLPSFTFTGSIFDILGNVASSELVENGFGSGGAAPASVTFTPNVPINQFVTWSGHAERLKPVVATVNSAGQILRNGDTVRLPANDPGLSVTGLQYRVDVQGMRTFNFDAPNDGDTVDFATVVPVAYTTASALTKGDPGEPVFPVEVAAGPPALYQWQTAGGELVGDPQEIDLVLPDVAAMHNTATNLLLDGQYKRDATWWAGELFTGKVLSTTQAFNGVQSLKITGAHSHHPNVTSGGQSGADATSAVITSEGGRVYRYSCRIYRPSTNTSTGNFRSWVGCVGAAGTDLVGGYGPEDVMNQTDMPTNAWFEYTNWFWVPYTGTHAPYSGVYPQIATGGDAADVFYIDNERFEDMTNSPPELVAPPPTGDRTTDTNNVQRLVNLAQAFRGTVVLREGTYAVDIVTARSYRQPRIVGQGKQLTFIDGTIKMCGQQTTSDDNFTGGWLEGFSWTGSHGSAAALELNGVTGVHGKELYVRGTYATGILFHNELTNAYAETCSFVMDIADDVTTAVRYKVTAGQASFHGCGLELGSNVQCNNTNAAVFIDTNARPYNAPMSARFWTTTDAVPIFQHNGEVQSNFSGNLCIEAVGDGVSPNGTGMWIAAGNPLYLGGSLNTYLGSGALNYGTFHLVTNVEAQGGLHTPGVSAGPVSALAVSVGSGEAGVFDLKTNGSNRWTIEKTSTAESGTYVGSDFQIIGYNNSGAGSFIPMSISRATGIGNFQYGLTVGTPGTATGSAATVDGTQTLTNKTIDGASNTIRNITSAPLAALVVARPDATYTIASGTVTQTSGTTVNGVTVAVGDRVLMINAPTTSGAGSNRTSSPANGMYIVTGNTTNVTYARAPEMSTGAVPWGRGVFVREADWANYIIYFNGSGAFTWGTTALQYAGYARVGDQFVDTPVDTTATQTLTGKSLTAPKITSGGAPANASSTGTAGQIAWDTGFLYVCTATNTWKRVAVATW